MPSNIETNSFYVRTHLATHLILMEDDILIPLRELPRGVFFLNLSIRSYYDEQEWVRVSLTVRIYLNAGWWQMK